VAATVKGLLTYGYAGTSTTRVAELAGVTRGAQIRYFPTKADLLAATVTHLAGRRADAAMSSTQELEPSGDPIADGLELIWQTLRRPEFTAHLELLMAARTDSELRAHLGMVEPVVSAGLVKAVRTVLGQPPAGAALLEAVRTAVQAVTGLLIDGRAHRDDADVAEQWQRTEPLLHAMLAACLPRAE
jgi:AcrR family transcriptional regulator